MTTINEEALDILRKELAIGVPLNCTQLGRVFGEEFWQLMLLVATKTPEDKVLNSIVRILIYYIPFIANVKLNENLVNDFKALDKYYFEHSRESL